MINHTKCNLNIKYTGCSTTSTNYASSVHVCETFKLSLQVTEKFISAKFLLTRLKNHFHYISMLLNSCHADLIDEYSTLTPWHHRM